MRDEKKEAGKCWCMGGDEGIPPGYRVKFLDGKPASLVKRDGPDMGALVLIVALVGFFVVMVACAIAGGNGSRETTRSSPGDYRSEFLNALT